LKKLALSIVLIAGLGYFIKYQVSTFAYRQVIPRENRSFKYKDGDLLLSKFPKGVYIISKVLKVEKMYVSKGQKIRVASKDIITPINDHFLIVHSAYPVERYKSEEEARKANINPDDGLKFSGHMPNSPDTMRLWLVDKIGNQPVLDSELAGYRYWKKDYETTGFLKIHD